MVRRLIGDDQRYLIPGSTLLGGILLLASDTAARIIISPYVLPVSILTAFMGAPTFIYLLLRGGIDDDSICRRTSVFVS